MASSSSVSLIPRYNHDVFLNFRGEDTRNGFSYHMYKALERENIKTFFDDRKLKRGEDISAVLWKAIEFSSISVVICSENYGSSSWCLDELVKILECQKSKGQIVIPVFYKVNPTDVRHQTGRFGEGFANLRHKSYNQENPKWKEALTQVANLSGWTYKDGYESDFIEKIVKEIKFRSHSNGVEAAEVGKNLVRQIQSFPKKTINSSELTAGLDNKESFCFPPLKPVALTKTSIVSADKSSKPESTSSVVAEKCDLTCPPGGEDKVVLYTTSLRGVNKTFKECKAVRKALESLDVEICVRDVWMDRGFREELSGLMKGAVVVPPRLFVRGKCVGGYNEVMKIVEDGSMGKVLEGMPKKKAGEVCKGCAAARFLPCFKCKGSAKIVVNAAQEAGTQGGGDWSVVKCPECNENGLVLCPICSCN